MMEYEIYIIYMIVTHTVSEWTQKKLSPRWESSTLRGHFFYLFERKTWSRNTASKELLQLWNSITKVWPLLIFTYFNRICYALTFCCQTSFYMPQLTYHWGLLCSGHQCINSNCWIWKPKNFNNDLIIRRYSWAKYIIIRFF